MVTNDGLKDFLSFQDCDNLWWDAFTTEFFEDDAMLTITFCLEDGPKRYSKNCHYEIMRALLFFLSSFSFFNCFIVCDELKLFRSLCAHKNQLVPAAIGRTLIPRYFRSIFEGGATELFYVLKHPKESFHSNFVSLDCDQCTMVTQNGKPMFTQVRFTTCTASNAAGAPPRLKPLTSYCLRFAWRDAFTLSSCLMTWWGSRRGTSASDNTEKFCRGAFWRCTWVSALRTKSHMHFFFKPHLSVTSSSQDPQMLDQLAKNITRCGLSNSTLNYLRVSRFWHQPVVQMTRLCAPGLHSSSHFVPVSPSSFVWYWSPCKSWCPDTRRTAWVPETAWRPASSKSGRGWWHLQVWPSTLILTSFCTRCPKIWHHFTGRLFWQFLLKLP